MKKAKLNTVSMSLTDLKGAKADYNPRSISSEQKNGLRQSIERFGYVQNIIYNKQTNTIISGHQRIDVLEEQGYDEVEVSVVDMSKEDEKKLNILMNASTIAGDFTEGVNEMLNEILETDIELYDMANLGMLYMDAPAEPFRDDEEEQEDDLQKGLKLMPYESYDAVLVVFKRRDDFMFVSAKLGLDEKTVISSPMVKTKKYGYTRAVDGKKLVKLLSEDEAGGQYDFEDIQQV